MHLVTRKSFQELSVITLLQKPSSGLIEDQAFYKKRNKIIKRMCGV